VTRKITKAVASISAGIQDHVELGNLDAVRDWGYAPEYVEGMWRMLQADEPTDYVLATGVGHTVRDFCDAAFSHAGLRWEDHVKHNDSFERPAEVDALIGDADKARTELGWEARTKAPELAKLMVDADAEDVARLLGG
jgi:GDPmannose 4,6-dehydratase